MKEQRISSILAHAAELAKGADVASDLAKAGAMHYIPALAVKVAPEVRAGIMAGKSLHAAVREALAKLDIHDANTVHNVYRKFLCK